MAVNIQKIVIVWHAERKKSLEFSSHGDVTFFYTLLEVSPR
jgi:hypothetical protein